MLLLLLLLSLLLLLLLLLLLESDDLKQQYGELSKRQLKHELRNLKIQNDPNNERALRYVSKLIRSKYSKKTFEERDHDSEVKENFWKYCKKI